MRTFGLSARLARPLAGTRMGSRSNTFRSHSIDRTMRAAPRASLTHDQQTFFQDNGYLVIEGYASSEECERLRERAGHIVSEFDPATVSIFSTTDQANKSDEYFLNSATDVSCFFEEKAFDTNGNLQREKSVSINKIGHAMHDYDPVFTPFSRSKKLGKIYQQLGFQAPTPVQSMYIFKQPLIGGEVVPHQDSTFLYTHPPSCVGAWFSLEDATVHNGCLWILPGSHHSGIARRMLLTDDRTITFEGEVPEFDMSAFIPVEYWNHAMRTMFGRSAFSSGSEITVEDFNVSLWKVKEGALVLLHGAVWHMSYENKSAKSRHAYSVHFVEGSTQWDQANWLQRPKEDPFKSLSL